MTARTNRSEDLLKLGHVIGPGVALRWSCMGCSKPRDPAGSKGVGLRRRCAVCLAAEDARKGQAA